MSSPAAVPMRPPRPSFIQRTFPIVAWLSQYRGAWLAVDIIAGLTVWGLIVPEGIAYAGLANLPAQAGLYTLLVSLIAYAILGTSRQMVAAGTSASATVLGSTIAGLGPKDAVTYGSLAAALVLTVGLTFTLMRLLRLGFVVRFISRPVMEGFITGLAIFIMVAQSSKIFDVPKGSGNTIQQLWTVISELGQTNPYALAISIGALVLLFGLPRISKRLPAGLIVLLLGILVSTVFGLSSYGVSVVGQLPDGLPSVSLPEVLRDLDLATLEVLLVGAIGLVLVVFSEHMGAADSFATKHGYDVSPDQELLGLGMANLASGLVGGLACGGSMSASAVNDGAGARTPVSLLTAAVMGFITVIALTPLFTNLPEAVLAALIIHAVTHMLRIRQMERLYHLAQAEFVLAMIAMLGVILVDVMQGLLIAVALSLLLYIYRTSRPQSSVLGPIPAHPGWYGDVHRNPNATQIPGLLIFRLDAPLFYGNAGMMRERVKDLVRESDPPVRIVALDLENTIDLDVTSGEVLVRLSDELQNAGLKVWIAGAHSRMRAMSERLGLDKYFSMETVFPNVDTAVQRFLAEQHEPPA